MKSFTENSSINNNNYVINSTLKADSLKNSTSIYNTSTTRDSKHINIKSFLSATDKNVISGLLILIVTIVGLLRITNFKYIKGLFSSLIYSQSAQKLTTSFSSQNQKPALILNILFIINTTIFIFLYASYHQFNCAKEYDLWLIPIIMLILIVFFVIKAALYTLVAYVFDVLDKTKEYLLLSQRHNKIGGLIILPFIIIAPYIELNVVGIILGLGIISMLALYLIQITRGLRLILKDISSLFYLFLYLCALEILPFVIMYSIIRPA